MNIAVIGAGMAGLRAALELAPFHQVTVYEKSHGVGGRVATRRFRSVYVNHGASSFDRHMALHDDPVAEHFREYFSFQGPATELPKAMRNVLLDLNGKLELNARVEKLHDLKLHFEDGTTRTFDRIVLTPPLPQVRELLGENILPEVTYSPALLVIGEANGVPVLENVQCDIADKIFELGEDEIRKTLALSWDDLTVKKWRYARVKSGVRTHYHQISDRVLIAGDAFDPEGRHDLASAWISGRQAGSALV